MRRLSMSFVGALLVSSLLFVAVPRAALASRSSGILSQRLPELKFQGVALKDCLDFLRDVTSANIHVNWKILEAAGISQDAQINLHVHDITLRKALNLILSEAGGNVALTFMMDDNIIEITTAEMADKIVVTRIYPVEDLIVDVPDFTDAPNLSLQAVSTGGSGGNGGGNGGGNNGGGGAGGGGLLPKGGNQTAEKPLTRQERADQLVELVREIIRPEIWKENGGPASIRYFSGKLIVTAPRSVQEAIGGSVDD